MEKPIAVVILNYNGEKHLKECLPNIIENSPEASIYVIDNASTDGSIFYLNSLKDVNIIELQTNFGYAGGYNKGLVEIKEPLLCLLNNDVKVSENWLEPILIEFENNPETSIVQPKILDLKNPEYFEYAGAAGGFIDKYGYPYCRGRLFETIEKDLGKYNDRCKIFWASGACFFIRNQLFRELNGFDDSFFAHMEEIDLCWRSFNRKKNVIYIPNSIVYHLGGGTLNYQTPNKTYLNFRNSLYTLTKNVDQNLYSILFIRMILDGIAGIKFLIQLKANHTLAILKAHFTFYGNFSKYRKAESGILKKPNYWQTNSVVWSYFIRGCKKFDCL